MSGGDKWSPRCSEKSPRELKTHERIEWLAGLIRLLAATDRCPEQGPEDGVGGSGSGGETHREENSANDMRARFADEARRLGSGENL
jgi:hypothetical protein